MKMTVNRKRLTGNFTQVENSLIRDERLSCEARMLMIWILSRPDGEQNTEAQLQKALGVSAYGLKKVISELARYGYVKVTQKRNSFFQFSENEYEFFPCERANNAVDETKTEIPKKELDEEIQEIVNAPELREKVSRIADIKGFLAFLLQEVKNALPRMRFPRSRAKYIRKIVVNQIDEYQPPQEVQPNVAEIETYCFSMGYTFSVQNFVQHYQKMGWKYGNGKPVDWKECAKKWQDNQFRGQQSQISTAPETYSDEFMQSLGGCGEVGFQPMTFSDEFINSL